ncbi:RidA family protein [Kibdelosporangium persicum]|uniref:Endoribonuclease L-PSP n=1 Tax=Kibdelosporangium persicum TaxID=2698649 RepID=A0ABX2FDG4_9PSEU|nr:RidA family protein [Kibdelosporangium persicum]NRN69402.1 Endoribonuclease L-PSP [Kibdelosporangium persicum]
MPVRTLISSGSQTEKTFGYSRAVRVGGHVSVAGTTAMSPDGPVGGADVAAQTREILRRAADALAQAGVGLGDVVRTRVFVTDIDTWREVGAVHREFFGHVLPASTIVEVSRLFDPRLLVEIEMDAIATSG